MMPLINYIVLNKTTERSIQSANFLFDNELPNNYRIDHSFDDHKRIKEIT